MSCSTDGIGASLLASAVYFSCLQQCSCDSNAVCTRASLSRNETLPLHGHKVRGTVLRRVLRPADAATTPTEALGELGVPGQVGRLQGDEGVVDHDAEVVPSGVVMAK